jgi:hypothetical protein
MAIICKQIRRVRGGYIIELEVPQLSVMWSSNWHNISSEAIACEIVCKKWDEVISKLTELKDEAGIKDDE